MDIKSAIKAGQPLIWLIADDEVEAIDFLANLANVPRLNIWTRAGLINIKEHQPKHTGAFTSSGVVIQQYLAFKRPGYLVMPDADKRLDAFESVRELKELVMFCLRATDITRGVIAISASPSVPDELKSLAHKIDFPRPAASELSEIVHSITLAHDKRATKKQANKLSFALTGLSRTEARLMTNLLVVSKKNEVSDFAQAKAQQISAGTPLQWVPTTNITPDNIGGMEKLKRWIETRAAGLDPNNNLPRPRGILLCGVPGTGKSLVAKAVATMWGLPLLRFDIGSVFGSLLGASEANMRRALKVIDAASPCVTWVEELEKVTAGVQSSERTDGGTTARVVSDFLVWLQERKSSAFIIGTINDITCVRPELMRKRRWDDVFWVDIPNKDARKHIFEIMLQRYNAETKSIPMEAVTNSVGFTGAEIEQAVVNAIFESHADGAGLSSGYLIEAVEGIAPQARSLGVNWQQMRARFTRASSGNAVRMDKHLKSTEGV